MGLLTALRMGIEIEFDNRVFSPVSDVASKSGHLVVCEEGDDLAEVIAANYAFALGAGLSLIPEVSRYISEQMLEEFYNLYEREAGPTALLEDLKARLRSICGVLRIPEGGSITFITGRLPYGFAFPEVPTAHLFKYPDLGISIVNGLSMKRKLHISDDNMEFISSICFVKNYKG